MKMVKSLLLGTAAGLVAMTGAQAADLPVKAKPVQYVKICSLYGAGFYYIPGTDTCLKVGGWVRAEVNVNSGGSFNPIKGALPSDTNKGVNWANWRVRGVMTMDARAQTEYGTLRSYIAGGFQWDNGAGAAPGAGYIPRAFVQWAGITAGHAQSFFDFYSTPAYSNTTNVLGSDSGGSGENVFGYTAQFGGGLSATVSAEDQAYRRIGAIGGGYGGVEWPDIVGNLRVDQAWGSAQVMGAVHQLRSATVGVDDDTGYAVGGGLTIKLPMLGRSDSISTQVAYAKGALSYVGSGLGTFAVNTDGITFGRGPANDAILVAGSQDLTEGWSVVGGFQHGWNPHWKTSLYGTYGAINYSDAACAAGFAGAPGTCDWSFWQAGSRTVWTPVPNLDLSVDVMYNHINTATYSADAEDKGWWQGIFRIQRNFYP
jgi:hypothetical protein